MINPMEMYAGKGAIPVFSRASGVVEWWVVSREGRRLGNPATGQTKRLDDPSQPVGGLEVEGYVRQGWVRYDVANGYDRDYPTLTEKDVVELVRFVGSSIASSKRLMIFAMIREWRLYRKWCAELTEERAEVVECAKADGQVGAKC